MKIIHIVVLGALIASSATWGADSLPVDHEGEFVTAQARFNETAKEVAAVMESIRVDVMPKLLAPDPQIRHALKGKIDLFLESLAKHKESLISALSIAQKPEYENDSKAKDLCKAQPVIISQIESMEVILNQVLGLPAMVGISAGPMV